MHRLLSIALSCLFAVSLSAQEPSITYPYNPDSNTDSLIGASDLVDFLPFYGEEFTPEPLTIEGMSLEEWMEQQTSSGGGGCDFMFPEGLDGEPISWNLWPSSSEPYTVPNNKNLYILRHQEQIAVDGKIMTQESGVPCIAYSGQVINTWSINAILNGILIDASNDVTIVFHDLLNNNYTVPENKVLYILSSTSTILLAGENITLNGLPLIVGEGETIGSPNGSASRILNGYLVDEDYFADCGGGGGVDISGLQEQIDAVAADSYAADAALLTASDNADDELQAQINANAAAVAIESQAGSEADAELQAQLDAALAANSELQAQVEELQNNSSLDSLTIVSMINDALSNSLSIGVGDYYGGGVVGYIFQQGDAGYVAGETHGYIFYNSDTQLDWGCSQNTNAISLNDGAFNTEQIVMTCPNENSAAKYCYDLIIGPYDDWFLPSINQISLLTPNIVEFNIVSANFGSQSNYIWTSNELTDSFLEQYGNPGGCGSAGFQGYNNIPHDWAIDVRFQNSNNSGLVVHNHVGWKVSPCSAKKVIAFRQF